MLTRRDFLRLSLIGTGAIPFLANARYAEEPEAFIGYEVFERLLKLHPASSIGANVGAIALALSDTPYVGGTLDLYDDREVCCINLLGLDCVTLYENALGFARMLRHRGRSPEDLVNEITFTRYRGGKLDGYLSRLHYTSDWFNDNEKKGVVRNLTKDLPGAVRMEKRFDFMSTHPQSYRQLKANPSLVPKLAILEEKIGAQKPWHVPNDRVAEVEPLLQTGDIVGIATSADGLDCSHTGLVYVDENRVCRFLNASSVKKKVVLGERLSEYAAKYKKNLGVMIARPL